MSTAGTKTRVLESLNRVHDEVGGLIASTDPSRLNDPTPCKDWNVKTLINHLIEVNERYGRMAEGKPMPDQPEEFIGDNATDSFRKAAGMARDVFSRTGILDKSYDFPWGPTPGRAIVQHMVNELITHGWDLAKATGRPTDMLPDIAEESLASWREWFDKIGRQENFFEPEKRAPAGAPPADKLAAFLGRDI